jgi:predicted dehydrogenase
MAYWKIPKGFGTLEEVLSSNLSIDVISICSPTKFHFEQVMLAIKLFPKLVFCEKPVTTTAKETKLLIDECNKAGVLFAVNYTRRWDPEIEKLKQNLDNGFYGKLRSVVGYYNKGVLNNGSHMVDLLRYLLGELQIVAAMKNVIDFSSDDPTVPALLQSETGTPIYLVAGNAEDYALFELQLVCAKGVLTMREGGMFWDYRQVVNSDRFGGYKKLNTGTMSPGGYQQAMTRAIENIYQALTSGVKVASDGINAYQVQLVCEQIAKLSGARCCLN